MKTVNEFLEILDNTIDRATQVPFSGGKVVVDADELRNIIDEIRLHLPNEIQEAQRVTQRRNEVIAQARKEAESITRRAEDRARQLTSEQDVVKKASIQANEELAQAQTQAREIRRSATDYAEGILRAAEDALTEKLNELRKKRQDLRSVVRRDVTIPSQQPTVKESYNDTQAAYEREYQRGIDIPLDSDEA